MFKLTQDEKVAATIKYADNLIKAGWGRGQAINNSRNLYNLSLKRMKEVENKVKK